MYLILPLEWVGDVQRPGRRGFHHSFPSEKKIIWELKSRSVTNPLRKQPVGRQWDTSFSGMENQSQW